MASTNRRAAPASGPEPVGGPDLLYDLARARFDLARADARLVL
jgi:hypothetical protein